MGKIVFNQSKKNKSDFLLESQKLQQMYGWLRVSIVLNITLIIIFIVNVSRKA